MSDESVRRRACLKKFDINECEIPSLAAICVENAECCNLPGHYVCKCGPGYTGNATVSCTDINECLDPNACGHGAQCENIPGSYKCYCPLGYDGDPFRECYDLDECRRNPCGSGAQCTNTKGGYTCSCPRGYQGNPTPEAGCVDIDECWGPKPPCGKGAECVNTNGGYYCQCPEGYTGNPTAGCVDINECPHACGVNAECTNTPGSYTCRCKAGHVGDPYLSAGCHDDDECLKPGACGRNAQCFNNIGSYTCSCLDGYSGNPLQGCTDIDECLQNPCSDNAICRNIPGSFECKCLEGYDGNAREFCSRVKVDVRCQGNYDCTENAQCLRNRCQCKSGFRVSGIECVDIDECRTPNICGRSAVCKNIIGGYTCECKPGYEKITSAPDSHCRDINECLFGRFPCGTNSKCINSDGSYECVCPDNLIGDAKVACKSPCADVDCGEHATCQVNGKEAACICNLGYTFDPQNIAAGCQDINECDNIHGPSGLCGQGAICGNVPGSYHCYCPPGFTGDPFRYCEDINECDRRFGPSGQCGEGATCTNTLGSFTCTCPTGFSGNGRVKCQDINECSQAFGPNGKCGISAICTNRPGSFECRCPPGTSGDPFVRCTAIVQCREDSSCRGNSVCSRNQCYCPDPYFGDECKHPCDDIFCGDHATCQLDVHKEPVCVCAPGYTGRSNSLPGCIDIDECSSGARVCGQDAICRNSPGSYECVCPHGYNGDPYRGCIKIEPSTIICSETRPCQPKEECVSQGISPQCVCKRGYTRDPSSGKCRDINECAEVRDKSPCGKHAFCLNMEGSYICRCPPGHVGNPYSFCYPEMMKCKRDNECPGNTICLDDGTQGHHCGCRAPFVQDGEYCIMVSRNCSTTNPCPENQECVYTGNGFGFCICPRGYTMDATGFCRDIDECTEIKDWSLCGAYAECVNLPGAYQCLCNSGYTGNPRQGCSRIEIECRGPNSCPQNMVCTKGQCQCLAPYILEGQQCKHPCEWYSCGQYATCELSPKGPKCVCIPGCTGDPNNACQDINECTADLPMDPNGPCSVGATCINIVGGYQCECPPGTTGDAYKGGCRGATGCSSDRQCPRNAICDARGGACVDPCSTAWCGPNADCFGDDHKAVCKCRPGYTGNPNDLERGCVSPCAGVWCGVNAHCIVNSNNQGVCHCLQGFSGNPWAGGGCYPEQHVCSASRPCGQSQVCTNGACVERCQGVTCGVGSRCDENTGNCVCLPYFIGNPSFLCVPPLLPPLCVPGCGVNAHCTYGVPNQCQCNPGFTGNPYSVCGTSQRCEETRCGTNANCIEGPNRLDCVCPAGLQGNPFLGCQDVNECLGSNPCGGGASCINSVGSFLCACPSGTTGNPLFSCTPANTPCEAGQGCACSSDAGCSGGEICGSGGSCQDPCQDVVCGPSAYCVRGACLCPQGMVGEPNNPGVGCSASTEPPELSPNECEDNVNCGTGSVCGANAEGIRQCIDVCDPQFIICGRNAICTSQNQQAVCECPSGMVGDPNDLIQGCQAQSPHECEVSANCPDSHICKMGSGGVRICENVCNEQTCGENAVCQGKGHRPVCECPQGFSGNPMANCHPHPNDRCANDDECRGDEICKLLETTGIRDCVVVCEGVQCGPNAICEGRRHIAVCECRQGFTGDAYDIQRGCQPPPLDLCQDSSSCADNQVCRVGDKGYRECFDVCETTQCGLNALCRGRDHQATCECRPGFSGNPIDFGIGCQPVPKDKCKSNSNCPDDRICRQTPAGIKDCIDVCQTKRCGTNAVCFAANHKAQCECPDGFSGDPNRGCQADHCSKDQDCPDSRICQLTRDGIRDCMNPCDGRRCGPNAQCIATGHSAFCECRDGFVGNGDDMQRGCRPRDKCKTDSDCSDREICRLNVEGVKDCIDGCSDALCGRNALCSVTSHIVVCSCPSDFIGDPYDRIVGCEPRPADLCLSDSECPSNAVCRPDYSGLRKCLDACEDIRCGPHATCVSKSHVAQCECLPNYEGNPYDEIKGCQLPHDCNTDQDCNGDEVCRKHTDSIRKCVHVCLFDRCGPNAECFGENHLAVCRCPAGYEGNPIDPNVGCIPRSPNLCEGDRDCGSQQICQPVNDGYLDCRDACEYVQCGPNAVCSARNHQTRCECLPDHEGDPYNLLNGCKPPVRDECQVDYDCERSTDVCKPDNVGVKHCIDACAFNPCGQNAECFAVNHQYECRCRSGFVRDPNSDINCIPREPDECKEDIQCPTFGTCKANDLGILKCAEICLDFSCSPNAGCVAINHKGQCNCQEGYTGDPNKRGGCIPIDRDECKQSEHCSSAHECRSDNDGVLKCIDVCEDVHCGPNAVCIAVGHVAHCQCPQGLYIGDAYDLVRGCKQVECITDEDCTPDKSCTPENYCLNPCVKGCGRNAICVAENHHKTCNCPAGMTGDAYGKGCKAIRFCESHPCHPTAKCVDTKGSFKCQCPNDYIGDPYREGCRHPNSCPAGDRDCRPDAACLPDVSGENMCKNPCDTINCGSNAHCEVVNHRARCSCPSGFRGDPDPDSACLRISVFCESAKDCRDNQACVDGQCRLFCSYDNECAVGEKCINQRCVLPCFAHSGCPAKEACVPSGYCQVGCRDNNDCPYKEACIQNRCQNPCEIKGVCGPNAICTVVDHKATCECPAGFEGSPSPVLGCKRVYQKCSPSVYCPPGLNCIGDRCRAPCSNCVDGEVCVNGVCLVICSTDNNCPVSEICINQYCQVGCRADGDCRLNEVCGANRCTCRPGFNPGPSGCEDNDECLSNPCHPTALCVNSPGSYYCQCREGDIGDGYTGCRPQGECPNGDRDCPPTAACGVDEQGIPKCINPCDTKPCGPNAECSVSNHVPQCFCPKFGLFTGDPYEQSRGCVKVDCLQDTDCSFDRQCINFVCESPCVQVNCGPYGTCVVRNRQASCRCEPGYENNGRLTCTDIDECRQHPCHATAVCENTPGSFSCRCPTGLTGNPLIHPGCHDPNMCFNGDSDCADSAACVRVKGEPFCRDPCEAPTACGINAFCRTINHQVQCSCPPGYTGDPSYRCTKVECTINDECKDNQVCEKNHCIDACSSQANCGQNTVCQARNHGAICRCRDGFYGDPIAGCRKIIPCDTDINCPAGELCQKGVCNVPCNSDRDCGTKERCDLGRCISICLSESDCPEHQVCQAGKCITDHRCNRDSECNDNHVCRASVKGYNDCVDPCDLALCAPHAYCHPRGHSAVCRCEEGYIGDPVDRGCEPVECLRNEDCPLSEVCENHECVDPCKLQNICGANAFCEARNHAPICRCYEGYEGDALVGCRPSDFCASRPCHHTAICKNKFGGYECFCPPERNIGNPYLDPGCRGENECPQGDSDCPFTAFCDRATIPPMCKNPCQAPDVCGTNALCRVENHRAACYCLPGFSGNPKDPVRGCIRVTVDCSTDQECTSGYMCVNKRCKLRCRSDDDCATREFCHLGQCVLGCREDTECLSREICAANKCIVGCRVDSDCLSTEACIQNICTNPCGSSTACGTNTLCKIQQHRQQCSCAPGFTGNPNIACQRILPSCVSEADCPLNHYCLDGKCRVECNADNDCTSGEKCVNNHCLVLCRRDQDCQNGEICIRNHCQVGCRTNDQCPEHLACVSNQCRDPCEGSATCGPNAECRVSDHRSVCSCREGFVGRPNANVGCIRPQIVCANEPCPPGLTCHNGQCRMPCNSVRDCAANEKCIDNRCHVQCIRDRDCYSGEICEQNFCRVGCRADTDCAFHEACVNNQCIHPCDSPTACGTNANCDVINHSIHCTCPPGLTGDAYTKCDRQIQRCDADDRCGLGRYCEDTICRVTCSSDNECLDNEKCVERRCSVFCTSDKSCPTGFICEYGQCIAGCRRDAECPLTEACINNQCLDPCASPTACGTKARCQPVNHRPLCSCLPEHTGDPRVECSRVECIIDSDCGNGKICQNYRCLVGCRSDQGCLSDEVCISRQCQKLCMFSNTCGIKSVCTASVHRAQCECPPGYTGNPIIECRRIEGLCETNADCLPGKVCINKRCEDDVECRKDEDCLLGHICQRNKCFVGCRSDENCALDEGCYNSQCQRVCSLPRACGPNARCEPISHRPQCSCLPGYTGNPQIECRPIGPECRRDNDCSAGHVCLGGKCTVVPGCTSDNDCSPGQICENTKCLYGCRSHSDCGFTQECFENQCQNPCKPGKCGISAECRAINHAALCRCPPDHTGDPKVLCRQVRVECHVDSDCSLGKICVSTRCMEGCRSNEHCPDDEACIQGRCDTPCRPGACGLKALCRATNHQAECTCPQNFQGNARVQCNPESRVECQFNSDCAPNETCENSRCIVVTGCRSDSFCHTGEICENTKCILGCRTDSDCTFDKACVNSRCINPCSVQDPCGRNADCRPIVHRPYCTCKPGFEGNPNDYCREIPSQQTAECLKDSDCRSGQICESRVCLVGCRKNEDCQYNQACVNRQCSNPCNYPDVCGIGARCLVDNHHTICTCPSSLTGDPNIQCFPVPPDHCYTDDGCGAGHICENNRCIDACRTYHSCPYDKDCINKRCQDPCSFFGACGTNAICHTNDHKAICTCEQGYTGDPKRSCVLEKQPAVGCLDDVECGAGYICEAGECYEGCRSDYQCSPDSACIRRRCEKVCHQPGVCGINAQCMADNHRPICSCNPGYLGDARVECRVVEEPECLSDSQCPLRHICVYKRCIIGCHTDESCGADEACINKICQNPCSIFGACGRNANCRPINHKPECTCPPNFFGNPNVVCEQVKVKPECEIDQECNVGYICESTRCVAGCRHDNNCPRHLACVNRQCQDPCLLPNSCGVNAECHADNHRPICTCPSNFRGDAYIECRIAQPDVECEHDLDCSVDKICENTRCVKGCRTDANCRFEETCINHVCQNPCSIYGACGQNAICKAINHDRICACAPGFSGNPHTLCSRIPVLPECIVDRNCSLSQICQSQRCVPGCRSNANCPYDETCLHGRCQLVCQLSGACGQNAHCTPVGHQPHCSCPADLTGDPQVSCQPIPEPGCRRESDCAVSQICVKSECVPGCRSHSNCPFDKACVNRICQDPCTIGGICGVNTQCHAADHKAICSCIPTYTGDPLRQCSRIHYECETDSHCGRNYVCVNNKCKDINECLQGRGPCALGAICNNLPGGYKCSCPVGLDGDPYKQGCRQMPKMCRRDEDCKSIEACNRLTGECYEVCDRPGICGRGALCSAVNHHHECYCPPGLTGNPYIECSILETCGSHNPCSGNLVCLDGTRCGCPSPFEQRGFFCIITETSRNCSTSNPCPDNEECLSDEYPDSVCVCPKGFVLMSNGICRDINECDQSPFPCGTGAQCFNTIGSYQCRCPPGTIGEPFYSGCQRREGFCQSDLECPSHLACDVEVEQCYDPCIVSNPCGRNSKCSVIDHSPQCECIPGFRGNPLEYCYPIGPGCQNDLGCPGNLLCLGDGTCGCPGDFKRVSDFCILTSINCTTTNPCPDNQRCVYTGRENGYCICPRGFKLLVSGVCIDINECQEHGHSLCGEQAECVNTPGSYECHCPSGFRGEPYGGKCEREEPPGCKSDRDCLYNEACDVFSKDCYDVCTRGQPCGINAICRGENHRPTCTCPPRYKGDPRVNCFYVQECGVDFTCPGNLICLNKKECGCPPNYERTGDYCLKTSRNCTTTNPCPTNEECLYTGIQDGFCVCPRGFELMSNGFCRDIDECIENPCARNAICTNFHGGYSCECKPDTIGDAIIKGCDAIEKDCKSNRDCPSAEECDLNTNQCISPCYICGEKAVCTARDHEAICSCPPLYIGDPYDHARGCYEVGEDQPRTVPPLTELSVVCLADGIQVSVDLEPFDGVLYVKGHSQDHECRRVVRNRERDIIDFKVLFNTCGLIHINGDASFILVIQKHPKLMTYRAKAYHIKCVYNTGEKTITLGFNVSMITTSGTIANTGPPPTCIMTISNTDGREVTSAEIGDDLLLRVDVQPDFIYGGFARSCVAKTIEDNEEIQYEVTDSNGCATDPSIFGNWQLDPDRKILVARFNAFKFPTSNNLRFQCNIRVCFGSCPPVNCDGVDAFGRKKRQAPDQNGLTLEGFQEGALREEIMVQSNAILTFERKENQVALPTEGPSIEEIDNVCLPKLGLIISLIITTLLALVAVAVAISCWLMAYRRRPKAAGPLPHPPDFPNPLYTTPEPVAEPSPDYYPSSNNSL
ncbi:Fibrillin-2 [Araneus ventricosus]|uniref:Fibrillin-2 n=1 Tax=Araneus ventricosus TaxID=182803 RepID=A0A4Y2LHB2_ARAVE|nr:Fibrillin-2 [Araneus ventricosus]